MDAVTAKWVRLVLLCMLSAPAVAGAWWNQDWTYRRKVRVSEVAANAQVVPIRITVANFLFGDARPDGTDIRFIASDDKTPLDYHWETFDGVEELAIAWVRLPAGVAGERSFWMYYGNQGATAAANAKATFEANEVAVFHFAEKSGSPIDSTGFGSVPALFTATLGSPGVMGGGAKFERSSTLRLSKSAALTVEADRGFAFSGWVKLASLPEQALFLTWSTRSGDPKEAVPPLQFGFAKGRPYVQFTDGGRSFRADSPDALTANRWHHIGLSLSDRVVVYVDGRAVASAPAPTIAFDGDIQIGARAPNSDGFEGWLDELRWSSVARSAAWIIGTYASQDPDSGAIQFTEDEAGGGSDYIAIFRTIARSVTTDGWVIIGIIALLGIISAEVIVSKALMLRALERSNREFLARFRTHPGAVTGADTALEVADNSPGSLPRVFRGGLEEFRRQAQAAGVGEGDATLDAAHLEVVKARLETAIVSESFRMNRSMVLLTLAVSAAPFLGLLGTVVGIMVTFGAVALAGDVNVSTIAPGIAAAITTTVAGLGVAIPAMFGYNFLATKIRELTTGMEVFANELVGRFALEPIAR